jgi:hypothetical protein
MVAFQTWTTKWHDRVGLSNRLHPKYVRFDVQREFYLLIWRVSIEWNILLGRIQLIPKPHLIVYVFQNKCSVDTLLVHHVPHLDYLVLL